MATLAHAFVDLLSAVLASDDPSLSSTLDALSDAPLVTVPTLIGFTVHADRFSLSWGPGMPARPGDPLGARSTLSWEQTSTADVPLTLVIFAARAGAWVDLGADLAWLTRDSPQRFIFDRDLVATMTSDVTSPTKAQTWRLRPQPRSPPSTIEHIGV